MKQQKQQHLALNSSSNKKCGNSCNTTYFTSLLPCLKCNHKYNGSNYIFIFGLLILTTLLNLCCGVPYNNHNNLRLLEQHRPTSFQLAKQWKLFTYNFLPHAPMNDMNFFNPSNILATGLVITEDRIFIATPKLFSGVPSTLSWVSRTDFEESPVLQVG